VVAGVCRRVSPEGGRCTAGDEGCSQDRNDGAHGAFGDAVERMRVSGAGRKGNTVRVAVFFELARGEFAGVVGMQGTDAAGQSARGLRAVEVELGDE
jgi:hypothetical protein